MLRNAIAFGLAIFMMATIVAYAVAVPEPAIAVTETTEVSPFALTLKAKNLPVESYDAI
jgi:hypothetical protein